MLLAACCAEQYDASHPAALGLEGFERKTMSAGEFKELVRRTFNLKLSASEVGALFEFFNAQNQQVRHFQESLPEVRCAYVAYSEHSD
jgi:hypothetical protein